MGSWIMPFILMAAERAQMVLFPGVRAPGYVPDRTRDMFPMVKQGGVYLSKPEAVRVPAAG